MRRLFFLVLAALCLQARAVDRITASITVTNASGTVNGETITVNSVVRTWTNSVVVPSSQILTNSTREGSKTNLYQQIGLNAYSQVVEIDRGPTNIDLTAASGVALTVTVSAGWATVTYSTQVVANMMAVRVPMTGEAQGGMQTNIASLTVKGANDLSTNSFYENAIAVQNLVGLTNNQTVAGSKQFTNAAGQWRGFVSNSPAITGYGYGITNGVFWTNFLTDPTLTNGINYGAAFHSKGSGSSSDQFGINALASASSALAVGGNAAASAGQATAIGPSATASGTHSLALGWFSSALNASGVGIGDSAACNNDYSFALGASSSTTADHQLMFGTSSEYAHFPGNVRIDGNTELTWKRYGNSGLANGNNAAVVVGTNTFMEVSGPSSAFTVNGIAGGRDGKFLIILNQTGQNMTIAHDSGVDPTAGNRIYTMTGADRATTGNGAAMLIYSGAASRWMLISLDQ